jgi:6-phosphofructokinase 1
MSTIERIAVLTSGGDAPGMNAALRSIVLAAQKFNIEVIGYYHGYNGLINQESILLNEQSVNGIINRGGTILKSARCKAFFTDDGVKQAANTLIKDKIDALIVIGGDGSFNGMIKLEQFWQGKMIGIPGTIDNDVDGTDYTIGYSTAVNTALEAIDKIRDTADAFERVFVVELMGRHSGHITYNVGLACAAEQVISFENTDINHPEQKLKLLSDDIKRVKQKHNSYLIVIAEHLWPTGTMGLAAELAELTGIDCTPCILGYIQRGGNPVAKDRILATKMGVAAIHALRKNLSNIMIGEINNAIVHVPISDAILHKKTVPQSIIDAQEDILSIPKTM